LYASFYNHFVNLSHYIIAFFVIFILYPRFIFKNKYDSQLEFIISNFIRVVFIYIVAGYILVLLKIFEFIGIAIVMFVIWFYVKFVRPSDNNIIKIISAVNVFLYDYVDGIINRRHLFKKFIKRNFGKLKITVKGWFKNKNTVVNVFLLISVMGYSIYIRIYDAIVHAAPAMSDAYVTLAWMKYINKRILFHDGIYPQGFHITMATLQKFSFIDPLYVLRYTGPLNGLLIAFGIYFVTSRLTKKTAPGIIAALIYGVLGGSFFGDWVRQAATNSQEFGFVFVLPTLYFFYKYMDENKKNYLITAFCGAAVCGLVHTISLFFVVFGVGIIILVGLILKFKASLKPIIRIMLAGIITAIISVIPAGIGLMTGNAFHGSSSDFISSSDKNIQLTNLNILDYAAVGSIALMFIYIFLSKGKFKTKLFQVFVFLFSSIAFIVYYMGGYLTKSLIVNDRLADLWYLTAPVTIGFGFFIFLRILYKLKIYDIILSILTLTIVVASINYYRPEPILPYKMERDSNVEQYFRITSQYRATEWMMVSQDEGYAVVMGTGYHMLVHNFLNAYDPTKFYLIDKATKQILKTQDIFIYYEKSIFTTGFDTMKKIYETRLLDQPLLAQWIKSYGEKHKNLSIFYEDRDIIIYKIHQATSKSDRFLKIWGEET
jgi:hypothetical protein